MLNQYNPVAKSGSTDELGYDQAKALVRRLFDLQEVDVPNCIEHNKTNFNTEQGISNYKASAQPLSTEEAGKLVGYLNKHGVKCKEYTVRRGMNESDHFIFFVGNESQSRDAIEKKLDACLKANEPQSSTKLSK